MSSRDAERDTRMTIRVEDGVLHLTWAPGLQIDGEVARRAMTLADELNAGRERPLLVEIPDTAAITREGRTTFSRRCSVSRVALVGRSAVARVLVNFMLAVNSTPVPTRFFTSHTSALEWLHHGHHDG